MINTLPESWEFTQLKYICNIQGGFAFKSRNYKDEGIPLLRISNISEERVSFRKDTVYLDKSFIKSNEDFLLNKGEIVIALSGATTGKYGKYTIDDAALLNQRVGRIRFRNDELINYNYIYYYLGIIRNSILKEAYGAAQPNISTRELADFRIPLAPLSEQHRIVAKIEELFTRLDAGLEALKHMQVQLKRYRQSVLKAAVEGKLTAEWRKQHKDELEPTDRLLERILKERREMWEAKQLAKDESQSKIRLKNWQDKYKEPTPPDTSNLPDLPEGWAWLRADTICEKIQDGTHFSPKVQYSDKSYRRYLYVTAKNIRETGVNLSNISYVDEEFHRMIYKRCNVEKNDVLLIKDGVKTGIATVNQLDREFSLLSSVALLKPNKKCLNPWHLKNFLNSPIGFKMVTGKMTGTAIKRIILQRIKGTLIAVPPIKEQAKIVEEVEKHISIIEGSETMIESELKRTQSLRQSILKRAFEGKLVPQDPNDLPASVLLETIKAEKVKSKRSKQLEMK